MPEQILMTYNQERPNSLEESAKNIFWATETTILFNPHLLVAHPQHRQSVLVQRVPSLWHVSHASTPKGSCFSCILPLSSGCMIFKTVIITTNNATLNTSLRILIFPLSISPIPPHFFISVRYPYNYSNGLV